MTAVAFWNAKRCLVTGAQGFIGTALCAELARLGAIVYGSGRGAAAPAGPRGAEWLRCDAADLAQVRAAFERARPDVVFHLAAKVTGARGAELVLPTFTNNLVGTVNVLSSAVEHGRPRTVCLGSLHEPDETPRGIPPTPYAASKFAAGAYARMFAELYELPINIARPYMVYGAGQTDYTKLVPYVVSRLLRGEPARMSSGAQTFDWVYVDDVVGALLALAATDSRGQTMEVGRGELTSVRDIAAGIARRLGAEHLLELGAIEDRKLEPTRAADVEKTRAEFGWRAEITVDAGLDRTVEWYERELGRAR